MKNFMNKLTSMTLVLSMFLSLVMPAAGAEHTAAAGDGIALEETVETEDQSAKKKKSATKAIFSEDDAVVSEEDSVDPLSEVPDSEDAVTSEDEEPEDLTLVEVPAAEEPNTPEAPEVTEEPAAEQPEESDPAPEADLPSDEETDEPPMTEVSEAPAAEEGPEEMAEAPEEEDAPEELEEEEPEPPEGEDKIPYRTIGVQPARMELTDENQNPAEALVWAGSVWNQLYERIPEVRFTDDSLTVEIAGAIPENVSAEARYVEYSEAEIHPEVALFMLELELRYPDGSAFIPEEPVTVTLSSEMLLASALDGKAFVTYSDSAFTGLGEDGDTRVLLDSGFNLSRLAYTENDVLAAIRFHTAGLMDASVLGTLRFEEESFPLRTLVSGQQGMRNLNAETESGTVVTVSAPFSGSLILSARDAAAMPEGLKDQTIVAAEVSLTDAYGTACRPETTVTVTLSDPAIGEAVRSGAEPTVWSVTPDGVVQPVGDPYFYGESVIFSTEYLLAFCVTVPAEEEPVPEDRAEEKPAGRTLTATDGVSYEVTVTCPADADLPENVQLSVSELAAGTAEYNEYVQRTAEALEEDAGAFAFAHAFDISLTDPETGEHYQPGQGMAVSIRLLQEEIRSGDEIDVVHFRSAPMAAASAFSSSGTASSNGRRTQGFRRASEEAEVLGTVVSGDAIEFETDGFSVYVIVQITKEKIVTASDGNNYLVSVTYDSDSGVPMDAELSVSELLKGTEAYDIYVQKTAEMLDREVNHLAFVHAFDIKLLNPETGEHYQPTKPVAVSIELYKEDIHKGDNINVVHFPDSDAQSIPDTDGEATHGEILTTRVSGTAVAFEATAFSVYVVTDEKPGVQYTFLNSDGLEYVNRRQRLLAGETLVEPTAPAEDGKVFVKWVLVADPADPVSESSPEFTGWGQIDSTDIPASGTTYKYLKAVFETTKQIHIRWYDQEENIIHQNTILDGATVDPNEYGYTAAQTNSTEYLVFRYWTLDLFVLDTHGLPIEYTGGTANGDVNLYPYCAPAHWLRFDANKSDTDPQLPANAPFSGPILVLEGEIPAQLPESHTTDAFTSVKGFTFAGWFDQPTGDRKIYNADGTLVSQDIFKSAFYTGGDSLEHDPTLYAHWTPAQTARYSVAYYVQDPANRPNLASQAKTYIFQVEDVAKESENALVGSTVGLSTPAINLNDSNAVARLVSLAPSLEAAGLTLNTTKSVDVTVRADGSTVFKVYFDRVPFTLSFYHTSTKTGNPAITLTALYGHDTSPKENDPADRTDVWPENNYGTRQWKKFNGDDLENTNFVLMPTMPAENHQYSDYGIGANYTYTRYANVETIAYNGTFNGTAGFEVSPERVDVRTFAGSNIPNVSVDASILAAFEGLELVRLEGGEYKPQNQSNPPIAADYQWYKNGYKNTSITKSTTTATQSLRYFNPSGSNNKTDYRVNAYYIRNRHTLKLHYILDGQEKTDVPVTYQPYMQGNAIVYDEIKYGTPLFGAGTANTVYKGVTFSNGLVYDYDSDHLNVDNEDNDLDSWWFYDAALTIPVDVTTLTTMPDRDLELYEGMYTAFPVTIDPAGGVLDGKNGSTWFSVGVGENIAEYAVTRDYVLAAELGQTVENGTGYFYVYNGDRQYSSPIFNVKPRTAVYVEAAEGEAGEYVSYPGFWEFQYWYKVTATFDYVNKKFHVNEQPGDQNTPFGFSTAVTGPVYLKAKWNRAGNYSVIYDAGDARAPKDTKVYSDGASAVVKASVDTPAGYQFRFWSTEPQPTLGDISNPPAASKCWRPNESLRISRDLTPASQASQTDKTITLHAWYETGSLGENNRADYLFYIPDTTTETTVTWSDEPDDTPYYIQTLSPGETLVMPKTPADPVIGRSGSFIGWFLDKDCTERFEGFGKIGAPENTKLYAGFAKLYTVTYMDTEGTATVTVQTYIAGDTLDTRPVEFTAPSGYYIAFWSTVQDDDAANPRGTTVVYNGKGLSFAAGGYTTDLTFYPTLAVAHDLSFNSMGGSYVPTMEFPRKVGRWRPAPENPTRDGWIFDGWFTAPEGVTNDLSTIEGGVQYKFDMSLEDFKLGKVKNTSGELVTVAANALTDFPTVLYAHWHRDDSVTRYSTVTVNYWVQNVARNGYILYKSEVFNNPDNGGKGYPVGEDFTIPTTPTNKQAPAYGMAGYKTYVSETATSDDSAYFEISNENHDGDDYLSIASTVTTEVLDDGAAQLNVYYNRMLYTLIFEPNWNETVTERIGFYEQKGGLGLGFVWHDKYDDRPITYYMDGTTTSVSVWLGKDISREWRKQPESIERIGTYNPTTQQYSGNNYRNVEDYTGWENTYYFNGWTEHHSTATGTVNNNYKEKMTVPSSVDKTLLPSAATTTYVLQAEYKADEDTASGVVTTVRYFLVDANGNAIEQQNYRQTRYDITGSGTGAGWMPDTASMNKILADKAAIPAYHYNNHNESREDSGERQVYTYYYRYKMPNHIDYEHYIARGFLGINIIDRQDDFVDLNLYANGTMLTHNQGESNESAPVLEGNFSFAYRNNSNNRIYEHTTGETVWYHAWGYLSSRNTGMSTSALRAMIDVPITADPSNPGDSGEYTAAHPYKRIDWATTNAHVQTVSATEYTVDLYYSPDSYDLRLYNGKYTDADGIVRTMPGGPATDPIQVMYTTYLTNNSSTQGYIYENGLVAAVNVPQGYEFAYWSTDVDAEIPFEGIMPERNLTLYAHYRVRQAKVTAQGVDANGNVYRETEPDATGRHTLITDANGVLMSWPTGADFNRSQNYGTRLQAYELPTLRLEPNEAFYGWKRLLSDGTLAQGYISSNTQIVQDTVVVPDIRYNKGGYVDYYANGGCYDVVDSSTDPATVTVTTPAATSPLYSDGGYYVGGSIKAKPGTSDGIAGSSRLYKTKTVDGQTYTLEFVCWNTAADGSGTDYYAADVLKIPDTGRTPLYAKYSEVRTLSLVYHLGNNYATATAFLPVNDGESISTTTLSGETVVKITFPEYTSGADNYPNTEATANHDKDDHEFRIEADNCIFVGWSTSKEAFEPEVLDTDKIRVNTNKADENNQMDENNTIHLYPVWAICKVVYGGVEHLFPTLNAAYAYVKNNSLSAIDSVIQMLVDYSMPDSDRLAVESGLSVTLTTAKTKSTAEAAGEKYFFAANTSFEGRQDSDSENVAVITRGASGGSLFINSGTFSTANIILDGGSDLTTPLSGNGNGGIVNVTAGLLTVNDGTIMRNSKAAKGSAIYSAGNITINGGIITGNTATGENGGAINVSNNVIVSFSGTVQVAGNTNNASDSEHEHNMVLEQNSNTVIQTGSAGLSEEALIGVYVTGDMANDTGIYKDHGGVKDDFGTYASGNGNLNLERFVNDRNGSTGEIDPDKTAQSLIRWMNFICQITDGTNVLYYRTSGTAANPRSFAEAKFSSIGDAYKALNKLYVKNGDTYTPYSTAAADWNATEHNTQIEMLVPSYNMQKRYDRVGLDWNGNYKVTLTTADSVGETCVIYRGDITDNYMFHLTGSIDLSLADITIDGRTDSTQTKGYELSNDGALFHMHNGKLTLNDGATLQNGIAQGTTGQGGAVFINGANAQLVMNDGSVIQDCEAQGSGVFAGGAVCLQEGPATDENKGGFIMNGGTIQRCSAPNGHGGAIAVDHGDNAHINGGTITECFAKLSGGAVEIHGDVYMTGGEITDNTCANGGAVNFWDEHDHDGSGRIFFSGSPKIFGNINTTDSKERNVDTEKVQSGTNTNHINKINVNNILNTDAQIGVWAPETQDSESEFFGRYTTAAQESFSNFWNDKYAYLVGKAGVGTDAGKLQWQKIICKIVDSDKVEHVFPTINAAIEHSRNAANVKDYISQGDGKPAVCMIQMLIDYDMPGSDVVTLNNTKPDNIILTTAPKSTDPAFAGERFFYTGSGTQATIKRTSGYNNRSMFTIESGASFTTQKIILDGGTVFNDSGEKTGGITVNKHGGIVNNSGSLTINNGTILQNTAVGDDCHGAAVYATGTVTVSGNTSLEYDYGQTTVSMAISTDTNADKDAVQIKNCKAGRDGAIHIEQSAALSISNATFSYCSANNGGGAVAILKQSTSGSTFTNCRFEYCKSLQKSSADGDGAGAIHARSGNMYLDHCDFDNCSSVMQGGAVYHNPRENDNDSREYSFTAEYCSFNNCQAGNRERVSAAGALETQGKTITIDYCEFTDCTSNKNAGAINVWNKFATVNVSNSKFLRCKTTGEGNEGNGGALRTTATGTNTTVENCTFEACEANRRGGAIQCAANITIKGTTSITGCKAIQVGGGAIYLTGAKLTIEAGTIQNCSAPDGGAIYQGGGTCEFKGGSIINCVATKSASSTNGYGGGIYLYKGTFSLQGGTISECKAVGNGGGIYTGNDTGAFTFSSGSISRCIAKAGGGIYTAVKADKTVNITATGDAISNCAAKTISVSGDTVTVPDTYDDSNFGGGIYQANGTLNITSSVITGCSANKGGGIYLGHGTLNLKSGAALKGNTAAAPASGEGGHGGGVYLDGSGGKLNLNGSIGGNGTGEGNRAVSGGGIYQNDGEIKIESGSSVIGNTAAGGDGGGIRLGGGKMTIESGANIKTNTASDSSGVGGNGGGIYLGGENSTFTLNGVIGGTGNDEGNSAVNGGGIYQAGGKLTMGAGSNVQGNSASADGGGIYLGGTGSKLTITGSESSYAAVESNNASNGASIYQASGTLEITQASVKNNTATDNGGGIYLGGGSFTLNSGEVGGLDENDNPVGGNTAKHGGGLFVGDGADAEHPTSASIKGGKLAGNHATEIAGGGGIAIGGPNVKLLFEGSIQVWGNTMPESNNQTQCDVCLSEDSNEIIWTTSVGLNEESHIGVYVTDDVVQSGEHAGKQLHKDLHGTTGLPFGTFVSDSFLNRFINNRTGTAYHGYEYYYGVRKPESEDAQHRIYWADYVCEITDANGNLLFTNAKATAPALYQYLGTFGAFEALRGHTQFYNEDKTPYKGTEYYVRMLVFDYALHFDKSVKVPALGKITLTMAPEGDENLPADKKGQVYKDHNGCATISRGICTKSVFQTDPNSNFTLVNVIVDGERYDASGNPMGVTTNVNGGLFDAQGALTLGANTVLKNSNIASNMMGGAINFTGNGTLNMSNVTTTTDASGLTTTGPIIRNCKATNGAALAVKRGNVTFNFNGGRIENCEATNGGVLYVTGKDINNQDTDGAANICGVLTTDMNAGENVCIVSDYTATNGGAVYVNGSTSTLNLNGTISGFSAKTGGGVYINEGTLSMEDSTGNPSIKDCTAEKGGAIFETGSKAKVNISAGEISGNTATGLGGGALRLEGGATAEISGTAQIKNNKVEGNGEKYGGAVNIKKGTLTVSGGTISGNSVTSTNSTGCGGAIHVSGVTNTNGTVDVGTLIITDGTISGNKASGNQATYGGAVSMRGANANAAVSGGMITGNISISTLSGKNTYGGALALLEGASLTLSSGKITGNTADGGKNNYGAGIYVDAISEVKLSGAPNFGGTGTDGDGNLIVLNEQGDYAGNFVVMNGYSNRQNGQKDYPSNNSTTWVRQDIYVAETPENPNSIKLNGDLVDKDGNYIGDGTIWIWAESDNHYKQLMPFAVQNTTFDAAHLKAFRNAQDDGTTENATDTWLYGTLGEDNQSFVYWTGVGGFRKVILRKVDSSYAPLRSKTFTIYKGTSTEPYTPKGETEKLSNLTTGKSGCIWVGTLPYGWYIVEESDPHRFFYIVVDSSGVYGTLEEVSGELKDKVGGYVTRTDAEKEAAERYTALRAASS